MVNLSEIPLKAISEETKHLLGTLLNPPKVIPASNGILRDWRGFAHVCKISGDTFNAVATHNDSFNYMLNLILKDKEFTLKNLKDALEKIERYDIIDDSLSFIEKDAEEYLEKLEKSKTSAEDNAFSQESEILTTDDLFRFDRGEKNQHYDAFLLYANEDEDFAKQIIENLENKNGLKLCLKDRDLIAGLSFEHAAIMKLISERCNRLLTVISPEFLNSHVNNFLVNYAQATGIDKNQQRKIIPCIYKDCTLPPQLIYFSKIYYQKNDFFWEKLVKSIKPVPNSLNLKKSNHFFDHTDILNSSVSCGSDNSTSKIINRGPENTIKLETSDSIPELPSLEGLDSLASLSEDNLSTEPKVKKKKKWKNPIKKLHSLLAK